MKKFAAFIFCALLATAFSRAQDNPYNFAIYDGNVVWQKVRPTDLDAEQLMTFFIKSGRFEQVDFVAGQLTCRMAPKPVDYKKAGFKSANVPIIITAADVTCFATIEVKDGRYRVTAEDIDLIENRTGGLLQEGHKNNLESLIVNKKGNIRDSEAIDAIMMFLDFLLGETFDTEQKEYLKDNNW